MLPSCMRNCQSHLPRTSTFCTNHQCGADQAYLRFEHLVLAFTVAAVVVAFCHCHMQPAWPTHGGTGTLIWMAATNVFRILQSSWVLSLLSFRSCFSVHMYAS